MLEGPKPPHRLRTERNAWDLTQTELARLIGYRCGTQVSKIENACRKPSITAIIASTILFDQSIEHLFKSLYIEAEELVAREAFRLHQLLLNDESPRAARKRELLTKLILAPTRRPNKKIHE